MSEHLDPAAGAAITSEMLAGDPTQVFHEVRSTCPIVWAPALEAWVVTGYAEAVAIMRDAEHFTVDDPRFTTSAVLGRSMLSLDGKEHRHHRTPFVEPFGRRAVNRNYDELVRFEANRLVAALAPAGRGELRGGIAAPMAARTIVEVLGLGIDPTVVLDWYRHISDGVVDLSDQRPLSTSSRTAAADLLAALVDAMGSAGAPHDRHRSGDSVDHTLLTRIAESSELPSDVLAPSAAVVLFGAIETSEGMIANVLWHLLTHPDRLIEVAVDRHLIGKAVEESMRLEPAAALLERYATSDVEIVATSASGADTTLTIGAGDPVMICLNAANRDPRQFPQPDRFDLHRPNAHRQLAFAQGPHACLGAHLARAEAAAVLNAVLDRLPGIALDPVHTTPPRGRVFRKPDRLTATWPGVVRGRAGVGQVTGASSRTSK